MTRFLRSVLTFYRVAPSQLLAMAWRMVLEFEALCALYPPEACQREVFSTASALRRILQGTHYFVPQSGVEKIIVNMVDSDHGMRDTWVQVTGPCKAESEDEREASPDF